MPSREYDRLVRLLRDAAVVAGRGGRIISANDLMCEVTGYARDVLLGMTVGDLISEGEPAVTRGLSTGISEASLARKDGPPLPVRLLVERLGADRRFSTTLVIFTESTRCGRPLTSMWPDQDISLDECLEALEPAVLLIGADGKVVYANNKCCQLAGRDERSVVGTDWADTFLPQRERSRGRKQFASLISGHTGPKGYCETGILARRGMGRLLGWSATTVLKDKDGQVIGALGYGLDTRQRKQALEALRDRDRLYRLLSENATDGIWTAGIDGNITYMSSSMARIVGYTSEELVRMPLADLLTPSSYDSGLSLLAEQLAMDGDRGRDRKRSWTAEVEMRRKDGSTVWAEARTSFIRDAEGRPIAIFGATRDVTERRQAEDRLAASENRYRTLFENSPDAIAIVARDGALLDLNRSALDLFGCSREDASSLNMKDIMPRGEWRRFRRLIERHGYTRNFGASLRRCDGKTLDCLLTFDMRRDSLGGIAGYEGSIRDITEYKRLQENLRLYMNEVTRAQENERLRLSRELHDGALQGLLALKLNVEEAIAAERRPYEHRIRHLEGIKDKIGRVAEELIWMSHSLRPSVLDHLGLVPAVQALARDVADTARIETEVRMKGKLRRLSPDVELGLFRIIQEALTNIRKHSGATRAAVTIVFTAKAVRVSVTDNGKGFALPEVLGDLAGSGKLGLVGMQERAQLIKGNLAVQSEIGAGTTVRVEVGDLPALPDRLPLLHEGP